MAKSRESSPAELLPESRTSSFNRKRTNSHLEAPSRIKALKRDPVSLGKNALQDYVSLEDFSAEDDEGEDDEQEHNETLGTEERRDHDNEKEKNKNEDNPNAHSTAPNRLKSNSENAHSTVNGFHSTDHDGETSDDDSQTSSENSDDSDARADDLENSGQAGANGESLPAEKTKKELRRERRAARREKKLLRAQQAVKRGKRVRMNGAMLDLPKGGNGFIAPDNDNREEDGEEGEESEEQEYGEDDDEEGDDGDNDLLVESKGVSLFPTPLQCNEIPENSATNNDFVPIEISSDSDNDDKDLHTRRLQQKNEKLPNSTSRRNSPHTHTVVEISDDEDLHPPAASVSSLESGEAIAITAPILTFPPQNPEKTIPRLRLLMQYYSPISNAIFPLEEERDFFGPVKTDEFRIPSPKRRKLENDSPLREFFQRQICGVCATEGHEENACEKLRCIYCFAWDKHFSHACPDKPPASWGSDGSDEETFNWRRVPPVGVLQPVKMLHPTRLNMGCYACASDRHFGDDCNNSWPGEKVKGSWSMRWCEEMGWIDKNAPPAKASVMVADRDRHRESTQNHNRDHGRDSRRDRDARRDQGRNNNSGRDRDWDRDIGADIRASGRGYRSRYGGAEREASPPRRGSGGGYGKDRDRDRNLNGPGRDNRKRSPHPPPPPRSQLPPLPREPLPPSVGYTGNGGDGGRRDRRGGAGGEGGLGERIRMMPSPGKREWQRFKH